MVKNMADNRSDDPEFMYSRSDFINETALEFPVYPYLVEEVRRSRSFFHSSDRIRHYNFWTVVILLAGKVHYNYTDNDFFLEPGMVLVNPPGIRHSFESRTTGGRYHKLVAEFKGAEIDAFFHRLGFAHGPVLQKRDTAVIRQLICELRLLIDSHQANLLPQVMGKMYELLYSVAVNPVEPSTPVSELLRNACWRLEEDDFTPIPDIAAKLGISRATLDREFREKLQTTPADYRRNFKMKRAKILLRSSDLSVKEIAETLGYCNQFHFSGEFKRETNLSPREYRKT